MGRKPHNIFRTSISVPHDLKGRMDEVEHVNWSAIACKAFEQKLAEIASQKEKKTMTDVVQRLKGLKIKSEDAAFKDGFQTGQQWAKEKADPDQLAKLDECRSTDFLEDFIFKENDGDAFGPNEYLARLLSDEPEPTRSSCVAFWEEILGDPAGKDMKKRFNVSWLRGFAEGALQVWDEVKDQI